MKTFLQPLQNLAEMEEIQKQDKKELWNSGDQWLYGVPESSSYVWAFRAFFHVIW